MAPTPPAGDARAAELQQRVFALIRASKPRAQVEHSALAGALSRLCRACGDLAESASRCASSGDLQAKGKQVGEAIGRLERRMAGGDSGFEIALPLMVAQSLVATTPTRSSIGRKRRRSTWSVPTRTDISDSDDNDEATRLETCLAVNRPYAQALTRLLVVWMLHVSAVVRIDELLTADNGDADLSTVLCVAIRVVLRAAPVQLPSGWRLADSAGVQSVRVSSISGHIGEWTSHELVHHVVRQLLGIAFVDGGTDAHESLERFSARSLVAMQLGTNLCSLRSSTRSLQPLLVTLSEMMALRGAKTNVEFRESFVAAKTASFLSDTFFSFLCLSASGMRFEPQKAVEQAVDLFHQILSSTVIVQVLRRVLTSEDTSSLNGTAEDVASPSDHFAAMRSVGGAVLAIVRKCSTLDRDFISQALILAHELAEDAVQHGKTVLLNHALDLAAVVDASPLSGSECYKHWFQDHFGADTIGASNLDSHQPDRSAVLRCRKSSESSGSCRLIQSKSHLQFVLLFILEHDRHDREVVPDADRVPWSSSHVMTHLSVMKAYQGQHSADNALIVDFCAQTRLLYTTLLEAEHSGRESGAPGSTSLLASTERGLFATNSASSNSKRTPVYSEKTLAFVDEHVEYFRDHQVVSQQLKKWKTFQHQKWKTEILPCCLDVWRDYKEGDVVCSADTAVTRRRTDVRDRVRFVLALAKDNQVPPDEYTLFLRTLQTWVDHTRVSVDGRQHCRRRQQFSSELRRSTKLLRELACRSATMPSVSMDHRVADMLKSLGTLIVDAHPSSGSNKIDQDWSEHLTTLSNLGFYDISGSLAVDHLRVLYTFQVPLLVQLHAKSGVSQSSSDLGSLEQLYDIMAERTTDDKRSLLQRSSCLAGIAAAMIDARVTIPAKILDEFVLFESNVSDRTLPTRDFILEKTTLYTCFLHALESGSSNAHAAIDLVQSSFPPHLIDFWSWIGYRIWVAADGAWPTSLISENATNHHARDAILEASDFSVIQWIRRHQVLLHRSKWHEACKERWGSTPTLMNMLGYEFQCGSLLQDMFSLPVCDERASTDMTSTLHRLIQMTELSSSSTRRLDSLCRWIIDDILNICAHEKPSYDTRSAHANESRRASHCDVDGALLLLNELIYRSKDEQGTAQLPTDEGGSLLSHLLCGFVRRMAAMDDECSGSKQRLYLLGYETLRVLQRHPTHFNLPLYKTADNALINLLRLLSRDVMRQECTRGITQWLQPALSLTGHQNVENHWDVKIVDLPGPLLVQWSLLSGGISVPDYDAGTSHARLVELLSWLKSKLNVVCTSSNRTQVVQHDSHGIPDSLSQTPSVFQTRLESLKFLLRSLQWTFGGDWSQNLSADSPSSRLHRMTIKALDVLHSGGLHTPDRQISPAEFANDQWAELVSWLFEQWSGPLSPEKQLDSHPKHQDTDQSHQYQLLLLHVAASACKESAHASKSLLSAAGSSMDPLRAVFVVLTTSIAKETHQLESLLLQSSSLWVNSFPEAALVAVSSTASTLSKVPTGGVANGSEQPLRTAFHRLLGNLPQFRVRVAVLVEQIVAFGAENRVDLLTTSLRSRIVVEWPKLRSVVERLTVLGLDDDDSMSTL